MNIEGLFLILIGIPIALIIAIISQTKQLREEKEEMLALERAKERRPTFDSPIIKEPKKVIRKPRPRPEHVLLEKPVGHPIKRVERHTSGFSEQQPTRYELYNSGEYDMTIINGDLIIRAEKCIFPNLKTINGNLSVDASACTLDELKKVEGDVNIHYPVALHKLDEIGENLKSIVDLHLKNELMITGQIFTKDCKVISGGVEKKRRDRRIKDFIIKVQSQEEVDKLPQDGFFNLYVLSPAIVIPHTHIYGSVSVQSDDVLFPYLEYIGKNLSYLPTEVSDISLTFPVLKKITGTLHVNKSHRPFQSVEAIGSILNKSIYEYSNIVHLGKHNFIEYIHTPKLSSISTLICDKNFDRRYYNKLDRRPVLPHLLSVRNLVCGREVKDVSRVLKIIGGKKREAVTPTTIYFEVLRLDQYTLFLSNQRVVINNSWSWRRNFNLNSDIIPLAAIVSMFKIKYPTFEGFKENEMHTKWPSYEGKAFRKIIRRMELLWSAAEPLEPLLVQEKSQNDLHRFQVLYLKKT